MNPLADYPGLIAVAQIALLQSDQLVREAQEQVDIRVAQIEAAIAFDESLKNDAQRKARRSELMVTCETTTATLQTLKDERTQKQIDLDLVLNQFAVAKLERRHATAMLEVQA